MSFDIASLIRKLRVEFLKVFRKELGPSRAIKAINAGGCGEFSEWLIRALAESGEYNAAAVDGRDLCGSLGTGEHMWTFFNGRHYDAEVPDGVEDWKQLPFFNRGGRPRKHWKGLRRRRSSAVERRGLEIQAEVCGRARRILIQVRQRVDKGEDANRAFDEIFAAEKARTA